VKHENKNKIKQADDLSRLEAIAKLVGFDFAPPSDEEIQEVYDSLPEETKKIINQEVADSLSEKLKK
jgi:hypothetical protein